MDELPALAVPDVLAWCGERSLQLGRQYARDGAVVRQRRHDLTLKSRCQGTAPQPYAVEVTPNPPTLDADHRCRRPAPARPAPARSLPSGSAMRRGRPAQC